MTAAAIFALDGWLKPDQLKQEIREEEMLGAATCFGCWIKAKHT